ncbi:MAG TPA: hypothetical protein VJU87_00890 [Gemmatimonadaceae bacterium]|nr:hypothetical protein [Gemmatimonadaceae bacterium]
MTKTAEYRQLVPRAAWMTARARNAMHRPVFIGAVSIGTFVTALVALIVMPQQAQRAAHAIAPKPGERPDTLPLAAALTAAQRRLASARAQLDAARVRATAASQTAVDTLAPALLAQRDSLTRSMAALDQLVARAQTAPLPSSYRALGESPLLAGDSRVRALLDSLTDIEKEREAFGTSSGADPVFVALTSRATEIGRAIEGLADQRKERLEQQMLALTPPPRPSPEARAAQDTTIPLAAIDSARAAVTVATVELGRARRTVRELDAREERARAITTLSAPPYALLASAIVFGVVLGFGAALVSELRHPRVADEHETERYTGVRVVSTIRPRPASSERGRRLADRIAPPHIDPLNSAHQLVWLFVAPPASQLLMLTISGEDPAVAAIVAANLGAVAADEARNVILIDTDASAAPVASALRLRARPGIVDIIDDRTAWPEATQHATIGRDRVIDVVASGTGLPAPEIAELSALLRKNAARLARHYDTVFVVASRQQTVGGLPGVLPMHDVLYCARVGVTRLAELKAAMKAIRLAGGNPLGLVLWDDVAPTVTAPEELAAGISTMRTAEMEALVSARAR